MLVKRGSERFRILGEGLGKKGWGQYFRVGLILWRTRCVWQGPKSASETNIWNRQPDVPLDIITIAESLTSIEVRSSYWKCSIKKVVFKNFTKIQRKTPKLESFFKIKLQFSRSKKETPTQVFSTNFVKFLRPFNTFCTKHLPPTAYLKWQIKIKMLLFSGYSSQIF